MRYINHPILKGAAELCFNDNPDQRPCVIHFSGGKDSTYMLLEMIRRDMRIDAVVFADTTMEFPAMYEHIDRVEQLLKSKRGISVTRLKGNQNFEELMFEAIRADDHHDVPGFGWPGAVVRWCTGQLKAHLLERFSKSFSIRPYCFVGFAADETHRLNRKNNQGPLKCYPLIKWGVTEAEALAGCYRAGYTWDGVNGRIKCTKIRHRKDTKRRHKRGQISPRSIPRKPRAAIW